MKISLSNHLHLPADAVTQKQAFLGMSGSGKSVLFLESGQS